MKKKHWLIGTAIVAVMVLVLAFAGCSSGSDVGRGSGESGEHRGGSESGDGGEEPGERGEGSEAGEGGGESGEHRGGSESGDGGEESGTQFAPSETYDAVRAGARLILTYDSTANEFTGTVANTTEARLSRVRVEVHLSNGIELGPTTPVDLGPVRYSTSRSLRPANPSLRGALTRRWADSSPKGALSGSRNGGAASR